MAKENDSFTSSNKNRMFRDQLLTREDLEQFRIILLKELTALLHSKTSPTKNWLKTAEVCELLNVSYGTLKNLKINGTLTYTKIGGTLYYDHNDIEKILNANKTNSLPSLFK